MQKVTEIECHAVSPCVYVNTYQTNILLIIRRGDREKEICLGHNEYEKFICALSANILGEFQPYLFSPGWIFYPYRTRV
jgi:hypothetical protein